MVVKFHHYEEGDVFRVKARDGDDLGGEFQEVAGPAWSLKDDDNNVYLSFGLLPSNEGKIGNLWAVVSDDARGHGIKMIKFARAVIDHALKEKGFARIQSIVREDKPEYYRFSQAVGLEAEGLMKKAAPDGGNLYLFARTV